MKGALFLVISALLASSVSAQPRQQERDPVKQRGALVAWAQCIATERPEAARSVLTMDFRTDTYRRELRELSETRVSANCLRAMDREYRAMRTGGLPFAGALAETLIERDNQPILPRLAQAALRPMPEPRSASDRIAMCMALGAPQQVAELFDTAPASADEDAAVAALRPAAAICSQNGPALEANALGLRSMLATASYRLVTEEGRRQ